MRVLAIDTALQKCSAAIVEGTPQKGAGFGESTVLAAQTMPLEKGHAEHLAPMVKAVLTQAGLKPTDLDRVGVVIGPGGFAGVRVGLAFARALALAASIECVGVVSLAALAAGAARVGQEEPGAPELLPAPIIDARRGQVYSALYAPDSEQMLGAFAASPDQALARLNQAAGERPIALIGNGAELALTAHEGENAPLKGFVVSKADHQIDPVIAAQLTIAAPAPSGPPAPLYLRPPDARPPASGSIFAGLSPVR